MNTLSVQFSYVPIPLKINTLLAGLLIVRKIRISLVG